MRIKKVSLTQLSKFETYDQAIEENNIRIQILCGVGGKENTALANKLEDCNDGDEPCKSLACKLCNRAFRIDKVDYLANKIKKESRSWGVITFLDYRHAFPHEKIIEFNVGKSKDRLRKLLQRSGIEGPVIGCFEMDLHDSCGLWLPHYHLLYPITKTNKKAKKELKNKLINQKCSHIKPDRKARPIKFQKLETPLEQISYIYKLSFFSVVDFESFRTNKNQTRKVRLKDQYFCDSLHMLDNLGRRGVQFSYGEREW